MNRKNMMNVDNFFLGPTLQLYTTGRCGMLCPHCNSRGQQMSDMNNETFMGILRTAYSYGARRIELFANDPLLNPDIKEQVRMLNNSGVFNYDYAVCTVGADPRGEDMEKLFWEVANKNKGGFVFSVDYTKEKAIKVMESKTSDTSYAFKALVFWRYAKRLREMGVPVRTNTVISKYNINEAAEIIRRVAEMGFAASFCFVQYSQPGFEKLKNNGLKDELRDGFYECLLSSGILNWEQADEIVRKAEKIVNAGELEIGGPFNCFRGLDPSEGEEIKELELQILRAKLLDLRTKFGNKIVLPGKDFILGLDGNRGFGCIYLLQQGRYPQMKVGSNGRMIFCCDLHDPLTQTFFIKDLSNVDIRKKFLDNILVNPYIWLCDCFNPCDFSVNRVVYDTINV